MENEPGRPARTNAWTFKQGLTGNALKMLGAALMVFDHLHEFIFTTAAYPGAVWMNMLGRLVLPIFLFMCAEGFFYTSNRKRYLLRLLIGFWVMNLGDWALSAAFPLSNIDLSARPQLMNNVFGTMFMVAFYLLLIEFFKAGIREKKALKIAGGALLLLAPVAFAVAVFFLMSVPVVGTMIFLLVPNLLLVESSFIFVAIGIAFYCLRRWRWAQVSVLAAYSMVHFIAGLGSGDIQWMMIFAVIPLLMYNGKRGGGSKYFFYVFYPAHIWLFYLLAWLLQR
ncbi:MAG: conjugal transfer protein TraX [Clostridiales bacterium]|jgi:hypothetical protein|nr:conjugal transfer protein TraX [Clostridiales bacterium]